MRFGKTLVGLSALAFMAEAWAGNLLFNSSFELGDKGYSGQRNAKLDAKGHFDYLGKAWTVDGSTAKYGHQSIRLGNPRADQLFFVTHEFEVVPGKTYTLSFWAKADQDGRKLTLDVKSWARRGDGPACDTRSVSPALTANWSRHSLSFKAAPGHQWYFGCFKYGSDGKETFAMPGTVWLDALQVEEGSMTDYRPAASVEAAVYMPEIVVEPETPAGTLAVISYDTPQDKFPLELMLSDRYPLGQLDSQRLELSLPAGRAVEQGFGFALARLGAFEVTTSLAAPDCAAGAVFVRVFPPERAGVGWLSRLLFGQSRPGGFRMGTINSFDGVFRYGGDAKLLCFHDTLGDLDQSSRVYALAGGRIFREWDEKQYWADFEPRPGDYQWERPDRVVEAAHTNGIELMVTLGGVFCDKHVHPRLPEWLCQRDRLGHPEGNPIQKPTNMTVLPPLEDWRRYVGAIATRYKGKLPYYEILNEPNYWMTPEYYLEYLRTAHEEIKKADPDAKVIGICTTEDYGADMEGFLGRCLALGAGDYLDAITFHPYGCSMDDSPKSAMEGVRRTKRLLKAYHVDKPLWNGEDYYLTSRSQGHYKFNEYGFMPEAIARRSLVDMGEGLGASMPLHANSLFQCSVLPHQYYWEDIAAWSPAEKFAVQSSAGHFLNGAVPLETVELPGGVLVYVFENGGKLYSALWSLQEKADVTIAAPGEGEFTLYDLFGNPIEKQVKAASFELWRTPYYLEWSGVDAAAAAQALRSTAVRWEMPFRFGRVLLSRRDASLIVQNTSGRTLKVLRAQVSAPGLEGAVEKLFPAGLAPLASTTLEIPVKSVVAPSGTVKLNLKLSGTGVELAAVRDVTVCEVLTVDDRLPSREFAIAKPTLGPAPAAVDFSASFTAAYDQREDALLLHVKVKDDKPDAAAEPWNRDSIELFIDKAPLLGQDSAYSDTTWQIVVTPRATDGKLVHAVTGKAPEATAVIKKLPDGYEADIRVPGVAAQGSRIGFDIAVNDNDGAGRKTQLVWKGSADNHKDRTGFSPLEFRKTPMGRVDIDGAGIPLEFVPADPLVRGLNPDWKGVRKASFLTVNFPVSGDWARRSFTFVPKASGKVTLRLMGDWAPKVEERPLISFDKVEVDGVAAAPADVDHDHGKTMTAEVLANRPVTLSFVTKRGVKP